MRRFLMFVSVVASACGGAAPEQFSDEVRRLISSRPEWVERSELGRTVWRIERQFYADRRHLPAWIDGTDPTPQLDALLRALMPNNTASTP